ncbi:MAG TPA: hypothetical protein VK137_01415, partial [Planctomycetaceae bacterium]|nr:hypothetical protein [Planctomycetaceae bacterium]
VVWSFVFKTLSMVVLRFRDRTPREFKVPLNVRFGNVEFPVGLSLIFLLMLVSAVANVLTKQVATVSGVIFTTAFLTLFMATERYHEKRRRGAKHQHLDQFNQQLTEEVSALNLGLTKTYAKLVAIRSPQNLFMLEKALAETDPLTTDVVVMTAKVAQKGGEENAAEMALDSYDQHLMTAVVERAERAGKMVVPLIVPTNNPLHAVLKTAKEIHAHELLLGASNKFTAEEQLDQISFYWITLHGGQPPGLTVRILSRDRDVYFDLEGGNRIPKISERQARSVAELRAAGVGVDRVLLAHDGTTVSSDLFKSVLTMLDPEVVLDLVAVTPAESTTNGHGAEQLQQDQELARHLGRELQIHSPADQLGPDIVEVAHEGHYDLIILALSAEWSHSSSSVRSQWTDYVLQHAHCLVFLAAPPVLPPEVAE